jgi:hypothetical protein
MAAIEWFEANRGAPYDVLALFGFLFRPIKGMGNMYFCDEACLTALSIQEAWRQDPNSAYAIARSLVLAPDLVVQGALA